MRRILILLGLLAGLYGASLPYAQANAVPEAPKYWVTDLPNVLSSQTKYKLNQYLDAYSKSTGHQVVVWIGDSTNGIPIEDWAVQTFASWKIGRSNLDDGVALFILMNDRKIRIEVGYGLEEKIPDLIASRIIQEEIVPRLQKNDVDGAVASGVSRLVTTIGDQDGTIKNIGHTKSHQIGYGRLIILTIVGIIVLIMFIKNPHLALWILFNIIFGGRGGSGNSNGGSRPGGGGRSGGGGASGSW